MGGSSSIWQQYPAEESADCKRKLTWKPTWQESPTGPTVICQTPTCTKPTWGTRTLPIRRKQVLRGRGFWPVIAIPASDVRSATLGVRSGDDTFHGGKGKDNRSTTHKGKNKRSVADSTFIFTFYFFCFYLFLGGGRGVREREEGRGYSFLNLFTCLLFFLFT